MKIYIVISKSKGVIKAATTQKLAQSIVEDQVYFETMSGVINPSVWVELRDLVGETPQPVANQPVPNFKDEWGNSDWRFTGEMGG